MGVFFEETPEKSTSWSTKIFRMSPQKKTPRFLVRFGEFGGRPAGGFFG